jgi:galactose mutarotase-like enzyme
MPGTFHTIRLRCGSSEAFIAPERGALVTSFRARGRELMYLDEATFNDRSKNVRGGIPLLFPSPGKLDGDRWARGGESGEMKQHGFARNLAWSVAARDESQATLSLTSNETTLAAYPWRFTARITFMLTTDALELQFDIANDDTTPMPFALGLHPYFLVDDKARARIPTRASRAFDNVAKQIVPFRDFDFTQGEVDIHLLDHDLSGAQLELADRTIRIDCSPELKRWVIWTLPGKQFICLEPWTAPGNALNTGQDLIELAPGARYGGSVRISS